MRLGNLHVHELAGLGLALGYVDYAVYYRGDGESRWRYPSWIEGEHVVLIGSPGNTSPEASSALYFEFIVDRPERVTYRVVPPALVAFASSGKIEQRSDSEALQE